MFAELHFLRPYWLLAILPTLLLWWLLYQHKATTGIWQQLIARHLQAAVLVTQQLRRDQPWALPTLALSWLLTILALSGPSWQKLPQPALSAQQATVLVMDMSMSMRATDMVPNRLTQQRFKALDLLDAIQGGDLALVAYAGEAFVISPLTPDHNNLRLQIPNLQPELMPSQGSNVADALAVAGELLQQAGFAKGDIILFTDGFESHSFVALQEQLNRLPYRVSIMAFGQAEGGVIRLENGELLRNTQGAVVVPRVPLEQLAVLARQGGGVFVRASAGNQDIEQLAALSKPGQEWKMATEQAGDAWQDAGVYLVWLLLPLALLLGRRAALFSVFAVLLLPPAEATSWQDLWQNRQQRANTAYQSGDYQSAQQLFTDPFWQGNAAFQAGDYAGAAAAFTQALRQNPTADAYHNLGNALSMQQDFQGALEAYQQALQLRPDDERAASNAALMDQLLQQQAEQQAQGNDNNQDSEQSESAADQQGEEQSQASGQEQQTAEGASDSEPPQNTDASQPEQQQPTEEQAATLNQPSEDESDMAEPETEQLDRAIYEPWPNTTPEQQQELENLLRKVQDDPGLLLRNRMRLEQQRRRHSAPPQGAAQEW